MDLYPYVPLCSLIGTQTILIPKYLIKHFEYSILALQGFSQVFGHNPSLYDVQKPKSDIFVIFVKKVPLNLTYIFTEGLTFQIRVFGLILTKIREFYLSNSVKNTRIS